MDSEINAGLFPVEGTAENKIIWFNYVIMAEKDPLFWESAR